MYVSKAIRSFVNSAKRIIFGTESTLDLPYDVEQVKYVLHSAHDWTVAQHMSFLNATNGNFTNVPFASQIIYELHSAQNCNVATCFWVEVYFNGGAYRFEDVCATADKCTYDEFLTLLASRGFVDSDSHYEDECSTPWTPPNHQHYFQERR